MPGDEEPVAEPVAEEAPAAEEAAPAEETAPAEPEAPPAPVYTAWQVASISDVAGGEGAAGTGALVVSGGDPAAPPTVTAEGAEVSGECPNYTLTKAVVNFGDAPVAVTIASGDESVSASAAVKCGPAPAYPQDGKYPKGVAEEDALFRAALRKVQKFSIPQKNVVVADDIWNILRGANPREYDKISFEWGISDLRSMLKKLANAKKNNKKTSSFPEKLPDTFSSKVGDKIVLSVTTANEAMNTKWTFNGADVGGKAIAAQKGCSRSLTISNITAEHAGSWKCQVGDDKTCTEIFVAHPQTTLSEMFQDQRVNNTESAVFTTTLSQENAKFKLLKDGIEFGTTDKLVVKQEGCKISVTVLNCGPEDAGFYECRVNGGKTFAELLVSKVPPSFMADNTVNASGEAVLTCTLADEKTQGKWFKNGKSVSESDRVKSSDDAAARILTIKDTSAIDSAVYEFRAEGAPKPATGFSVAVGGVTCNLGAAQVCFNYAEGPASLVCKVGGSFSLSGPADVKANGGDVASDGERFKAEGASITCANAFATDSATYNFGDASFAVSVLDVPAAPGAGAVSDLTDETCRLDWTPCANDGGSAIQGFNVYRKKAGNSSWVKINNIPVKRHNYLIRRLVDGASYQLQVRAINAVGESEPSNPTDTFTPLAPPVNVTALKVGACTDATIQLKWNLPEEVGAAGIDGYEVFSHILEGGLVSPDPFSVTDAGWKKAMIAGSIVPAADTDVIVKGLDTGKNYMLRVRSKNSAGFSSWAQAGPACCAANVEEPKVLLPRILQKQTKINVGEKLHLNIPFQGSPKPIITWKKFVPAPPAPVPEPEPVAEGEEPKPVPKPEPLPDIEMDLPETATVRNSKDASVVFIRNTERADSGKYQVTVEVQDLVSTAVIDVAVVDVPSKPRKPAIVEVIGNSVQLSWNEPKDNGNCDIIGYSVEKRDKRSGPESEWYIVYDKVRHQQCNVDELIIGNEYQFRIKAINEVGSSDGVATKEFANIPKETTTYVKPVYPEMNFDAKPEFTTVLNNRKIMVGYTGVITCAMKGAPRPKLRWFRNKMEIIDNPKYKISWGQGIVQLEIRRARLGDSGTYTCVAENGLGEDSVSCEVLVREVIPPGATKSS